MSAGNPVEGVAARIKLPPGVTFHAGLENAGGHCTLFLQSTKLSIFEVWGLTTELLVKQAFFCFDNMFRWSALSRHDVGKADKTLLANTNSHA